MDPGPVVQKRSERVLESRTGVALNYRPKSEDLKLAYFVRASVIRVELAKQRGAEQGVPCAS